MPPEITQGLEIVGFYASGLGFVLVWLALACVFARQGARVSIGDGDDPRLIRAMRGQANFTEYVPVCLVLFALMAALGAPPWELHALGLALLLGRVAHALHFTRADAPAWQRGAGAGLTLVALIAASVGLLVHTLPRMF